MIDNIRILVFLLLALPGICMADLPQMIPMGSGEIRYLGIFKVYDATLTVNQTAPIEKILGGEISKCLKLEYSVSLTVEDFIRGADTVLQRQHSKEEVSGVQQYIDALHAKYRDVKKGDSYSLCYNSANSTTTLALNKEELVRIASKDFARLYFGIWLGPNAPLDEQLRDDLLQVAGGS